ncbi:MULTISPECIES: NUDIX domain-containing protein [Mesobacillus]|uniref:NUDIX domain-containing protein n=1 Tax=Mesobacillus TaxID=2675231 RepID=UPI001784C82F|nr:MULTISPECIES: NUDIX hydrolase [Mesobacillus]MCM3573969.1 NUDIX hydrolase [Mesobacillus subterraneus]UYZ20268.1 NUDIX hydrolase [Mesobacillus jeotgali]
MVTKQNNGFELIEILEIKELDMGQYQPLAGSYAIIKVKGQYLIGYNIFRQQWEVPAGKREKGEAPLDCARRELLEETGQTVVNLKFIGLARVKNLLNGAEKFNPLYYSTTNSLRPFRQNEEMSDIRLWDLEENLHIDQVDLEILEYVSLLK